MLATVRLWIAVVFVVAMVFASPGPATAQTDIATLCESGRPTDWVFMTEGSGAGAPTSTSAGLLCNYRVSDDALARGVPSAGAAITVEYLCDADVQNRFQSVSGGATPQSGGGGGTYVLKEEFGSFSSNAGTFSRQHKLHVMFSPLPRAFATVVLYHDGGYNAARDLYSQAAKLVQANYGLAQQLSGCPAVAGTGQPAESATGPCSRPRTNPQNPTFSGGAIAIVEGWKEGHPAELDPIPGERDPARDPVIQPAGCQNVVRIGSPGRTGELLRRGDRVFAGQGTVVLLFPNGARAMLYPGTAVDVGYSGSAVYVRKGTVAVRTETDVVSQQLETQPFVTGSSTAVIRHYDTIYEVGYEPATGATTVRAIEGRLIVTPANSSLSPVTLTTGQQVLVSGDQISGVSALSGVRQDPFVRLEEGQFSRASDQASSDGNGTVVFLLVGLLVLGIVGASIAVMSAQRAPAATPATEPATEPATGVAADSPGWYSDPTGEARLRYWDGIRWTESTSG